MRSHKFRHNSKKEFLTRKNGSYDYSKLYRMFHKHGTLLESGWYDTQTWGALHKAWIGYVIAKSKEEYNNLIKYASIIQKLQKELDIEVSSFPQLDMMISSLEDDEGYRDNEEGYTW